jgi:hypothetical protein
MSESASQLGVVRKPVWYRSTVAAAFILGICNLAAPGCMS